MEEIAEDQKDTLVEILGIVKVDASAVRAYESSDTALQEKHSTALEDQNRTLRAIATSISETTSIQVNNSRSLAAGVKKAFSAPIKLATSPLKKLGDVITAPIRSVKAAIQTPFVAIGDGIKNISSGFKKVGESIARPFKAIGNFFKKTPEEKQLDVLKKINKNTQVVAKRIESLEKAFVGNDLKKLENQKEEVARQNKLIAAIEGIGVGGVAAGAAGTSNNSTGPNSVLGKLKETVTNFFKNPLTATAIGARIASKFKGIKAAIKKPFTNISKFAKSAFSSFKTKATSFLSNVKSSVKPAVAKTLETAKTVATTAAQKVKTAAAPVVQKVKTAAAPVAQRAQAAAKPVIENVKAAAAPVVQKAKQSRVGSAFKKLKAGVKAASANVKSIASAGKGAIIKNVQKVLKASTSKILAKGFLKRIPLIAGLVETVFARGDIKKILADPTISKAEKEKAVGTRVLKGIGGVAGAGIGYAIGAALTAGTGGLGAPLGIMAATLGGDFLGRFIGGQLPKILPEEKLGKAVMSAFFKEDSQTDLSDISANASSRLIAGEELDQNTRQNILSGLATSDTSVGRRAAKNKLNTKLAAVKSGDISKKEFDNYIKGALTKSVERGGEVSKLIEPVPSTVGGRIEALSQDNADQQRQGDREAMKEAIIMASAGGRGAASPVNNNTQNVNITNFNSAQHREPDYAYSF